MHEPAAELFAYRRHRAHKLGTAPFLPMSRDEMDQPGWTQCDVILVTGDAYVDHPGIGMAVVDRLLTAFADPAPRRSCPAGTQQTTPSPMTTAGRRYLPNTWPDHADDGLDTAGT